MGDKSRRRYHGIHEKYFMKLITKDTVHIEVHMEDHMESHMKVIWKITRKVIWGP